jgi:hypothetical protein
MNTYREALYSHHMFYKMKRDSLKIWTDQSYKKLRKVVITVLQSTVCELVNVTYSYSERLIWVIPFNINAFQ